MKGNVDGLLYGHMGEKWGVWTHSNLRRGGEDPSRAKLHALAPVFPSFSVFLHIFGRGRGES